MMKRARLAVIWLLVLLPVMTAVMFPVYAAESGYTETNSYALNYNGVYEGSKWQYFSPYWASWIYEGSSDNEALISFTLCNTVTGEGFPTYCTDIDTGLDNNSNYRRLNLEDSTYHDGGAAGVLRSIILKGFPSISAEALGEAAGVTDLTVGEAVAATQLAIWKVTHGNRVEFTDLCYYIDTEWNASATEHYDECNKEILNGYASAENEALIESHIQQVYGYLVTLDPMEPTGVAVSNAAFKSWSAKPSVTDNGDGTCDVTVSATVEVEMTGSDHLTLTAEMGGYYTSATLSSGSNTETLTIANVPSDVARGDVRLAIDGMQTVSDVFLFDAVGDRGTSQSLIGKNSSQLPVHAEITVETERAIHFVKTGGGIPLEGIQFDIYFVATREDYLSGAADLPDPDDYAYSGNPVYTVTTDADGKGSFSLTRNNQPDGVYLVVEREHPAIVAPVAPFYVILPATSLDGTHLEYEVTAYPKNTVRNDIQIEKDVISVGNDEASVDAYVPHTWIIGASIPQDIAEGKAYVISDTLDNRLDFLGNVKVQVETNDASAVQAVLTENVDYIVTVSDHDSVSGEKLPDAFAVALTAAGRVKVANAVGSTGFASHMIRVFFDAQINSNASMGEEIPNQAELDYTNSFNIQFEVQSDIPRVYTGGIQILKTDAEDHAIQLEGAQFQLYRVATAAEIADETIVKETVEGINGSAIPVAFLNTPDLTGERVYTAASDADGKVYIYGLAYGTYYLVETQAPAGYNLLYRPVELTIHADSHLEEYTLVVENVSGTMLPETGGVGTELFVSTGAVLILTAGLLLVLKKRQTR